METILIVDDHSDNRAYLLYLLSQVGHRLLEAADGAEALEIARTARPDLAIVDLVMPTMDGYEFVRQLRADPAIAQTRVIFYTATYLVAEARPLAKACGVHHILSKPTDPDAILKIVDATLTQTLPLPYSPLSEDFHREHIQVITNKLAKKIEALEQEVSERKQAEERIRHLAYYDLLTGLPNRLQFEEILTGKFKQAIAEEKLLGVFLLDLDSFRDIVDQFGYETGDRLLGSVAHILRENPRILSAARLSGDLFALLATPLSCETDAQQIVRHIQEQLEALMDTDEYREIFLTTRIGGALFPKDGNTAAALLQKADSALSRAKAKGKNCIFFFDRKTTEKMHARLAFKAQIRRALEQQEFVLHYQPKINLSTFSITAVEALIRWQKPGQGLVPPGVFIPVAEETRLIIPISEWCLREAARQWLWWQKLNIPSLRMAVNLSPRQFEDPALAEHCAALLAETGMDPSYVDFEITESVLLQGAEPTQRTLKKLRELGCSLSLDDFGVGYSSFNYLKTFPIQNLKIDRSFIQHIASEKKDAAITDLIIRIAHTLGLTVVAEGVETLEQLTMLKNYACDEVQGYYIAKPLEAEPLTHLLQGETFSLLREKTESKWRKEMV